MAHTAPQEHQVWIGVEQSDSSRLRDTNMQFVWAVIASIRGSLRQARHSVLKRCVYCMVMIYCLLGPASSIATEKSRDMLLESARRSALQHFCAEAIDSYAQVPEEDLPAWALLSRAQCYFELGEYENAKSRAMCAIDLVKSGTRAFNSRDRSNLYWGAKCLLQVIRSRDSDAGSEEELSQCGDILGSAFFKSRVLSASTFKIVIEPSAEAGLSDHILLTSVRPLLDFLGCGDNEGSRVPVPIYIKTAPDKPFTMFGVIVTKADETGIYSLTHELPHWKAGHDLWSDYLLVESYAVAVDKSLRASDHDYIQEAIHATARRYKTHDSVLSAFARIRSLDVRDEELLLSFYEYLMFCKGAHVFWWMYYCTDDPYQRAFKTSFEEVVEHFWKWVQENLSDTRVVPTCTPQ